MLLGRQQHLAPVFLTKPSTNPDSPLCLLSLLCYLINNSLSSSAPCGLGHCVGTIDERQEFRDRLLPYKRLTLLSADWISFAGASLLLTEMLDYLQQHTENRADSYNFLLHDLEKHYWVCDYWSFSKTQHRHSYRDGRFGGLTFLVPPHLANFHTLLQSAET